MIEQPPVHAVAGGCSAGKLLEAKAPTLLHRGWRLPRQRQMRMTAHSDDQRMETRLIGRLVGCPENRRKERGFPEQGLGVVIHVLAGEAHENCRRLNSCYGALGFSSGAVEFELVETWPEMQLQIARVRDRFIVHFGQCAVTHH